MRRERLNNRDEIHYISYLFHGQIQGKNKHIKHIEYPISTIFESVKSMSMFSSPSHPNKSSRLYFISLTHKSNQPTIQPILTKSLNIQQTQLTKLKFQYFSHFLWKYIYLINSKSLLRKRIGHLNVNSGFVHIVKIQL